jgi:predicted enzyme related to lactoylglutathione lyase
MTKINGQAAGNFVWLELATPDQDAAKRFYGEIFGWTAQDFPMGPESAYTMFSLGGSLTGAAYTLSEPERAAGLRPHWQLYIAVEDADATAERAKGLGASVVHAPFDVMNFGRMAVFQDPTGAFFSVWQARDHKGIGVYGENGALCWADLMTRDRAKATEFYHGLFGWEFTAGKGKDAGGYLHIMNGDHGIGGLPDPQSLPQGVPPHWMAYIQSPDCKAQTAQAEQLGGRVLMPAMTIEGQLTFSVVTDPQGAVFALFTPGH